MASLNVRWSYGAYFIWTRHLGHLSITVEKLRDDLHKDFNRFYLQRMKTPKQIHMTDELFINH